MERFQSKIGWAVVVSQLTHVFCCGLPLIVSVLSLVSGFGLMGVVPGFIHELHDALHDWEIPMLIGSGIVLFLGWALVIYSRRLDCSTSEACSHTPCAPKKKKSFYILSVATVLFVINLFVIVALEH